MQREEDIIRGYGNSFQSMCPPSRFPYIAVKFGGARRKWTDCGEGRFAEEGKLGASSTDAKAH